MQKKRVGGRALLKGLQNKRVGEDLLRECRRIRPCRSKKSAIKKELSSTKWKERLEKEWWRDR